MCFCPLWHEQSETVRQSVTDTGDLMILSVAVLLCPGSKELFRQHAKAAHADLLFSQLNPKLSLFFF